MGSCDLAGHGLDSLHTGHGWLPRDGDLGLFNGLRDARDELDGCYWARICVFSAVIGVDDAVDAVDDSPEFRKADIGHLLVSW